MRKSPIATISLLAINVIVFCWLAWNQQSLMLDRSEDVLAILSAGGNLNPLTLGGEPWRIITSMFLHFGILHLLVNMFALYSMGIILEPAIGTPRLLMVYFFCGIAAGIASLIFNVYVISAGASGALFGLYGYRLGAELVHSFGDRKQLTAVVINFVIFVVINGLVTLRLNVDLSGHVGGCLAGLLLALVQFRFHLLVKPQHLAFIFLPVCLGLLLLPRDQVDYYRIFQRVIQTEKHTNQLYREKMADAQLLDSLKYILNEWDSIEGSFASLPGVRSALQSDTATMHQYVKLHRKETFYRVTMIDKDSYVYMDSLELMNLQFDSLSSFVYNLNYNSRIPRTEEVEPSDSTSELTPKRIFYDASWKEIDDPSLALYYRVGTTDSLGRFQGMVRDYYRNGTIQMKGRYLDNMKHGVFLYYSSHGTYSSAGRYEKEESVGKWETYHWNGILEREVYYGDRTFIRNIWDSLGRPQVTNGNGKFTNWYKPGQVSETGNYEDGRKEGDWFGYHDDGTPYYREVYHDNKLLKGVSVDQDGKRFIYDELSLYAYPVKGMTEFNKHVSQNIRRPGAKMMDAGIVKVVFNVGDDGSVWDFVFIQGLTPAHEQEAMRLIKSGPRWRPGLLHGHIYQPSQGYAEIAF
ncbi:MAG TPA: rhomboid family intramembrane serine protease [Chryseolinea sp.]|nr:rhomboid family intramembrane serine protease [Chryseolinea sp.]